jgi:ankyrin repeat protein
MADANVQAFCRALWRHEVATVASLVRRVDPNAKDKWGNTPMLMAAQYGDLATVALLVRRGATLDQGRTYLTPITYAALRQAFDIVKFLREKGATVSIITSIHLGERARVLEDLSRDRAQACLRDEEGAPILHHASLAVDLDLVLRLLELGATVADANRYGETALHRLANMRQGPREAAVAIAALLLDRGADPNACNWDDVTPLHQAVRARNLPIVELLLARGADPNARDRIRGSTPLRRAVSATGAGGTAGTTALMVPLARALLRYGADPDAIDKRGIPVYESARAPDVRAVLDEHRRNMRGAKDSRPPKDTAQGKPPRGGRGRS